MMPAYRSMDSYQRNQMQFPHCYYPGIESISPQMKIDPPKYEQPWQCAGSYGHPIPMHFCCARHSFPVYYNYRPPYAHAPAPSATYHSGCFPAYGEPFFVPYAPQLHYTTELPRYEYDKYMPGDYHCCGCPNHPCHQKEGKSVKIEEQEPDVGKRVNDSLVPIQLKSHPYPFSWIPPDYTSNGELKTPAKAEVGQQDKMSYDRKPPSPRNFKADTQEPGVWNGWLPFDMNGTPSMVHERDGTTNQKHQSEHKRSEFPFPIIWMPHYNKQEEGGRTNNKESTSPPNIIEEVPRTYKSVPGNFHADESVAEETRSNQDESTNTSGSDFTEKVTKERIIPVKQVEFHEGKNDLAGSEKRERNLRVNQREENVAQKDSLTIGERQSVTPRKTSKLPPVCLRVDPLPRIKNGNGSSRSPSPPASKEHSQPTAGEASKTTSGSMNDKAESCLNHQSAPNTIETVKPKEITIQVTDASKDHSQKSTRETSNTHSSGMDLNLRSAPKISQKAKSNERTILVTENKTSESKGVDSKGRSQHQKTSNMHSGVSTGAKESCADGDKYKTEENKAEIGEDDKKDDVAELRVVKGSSKPIDEDPKQGEVLSAVDAAVLIQATYRGYQVRKWEPLKKLKQIAEVGEEMAEVRDRIQAFEDSSDPQNDDKQRIVIGETIMRLLLKLDTIQGLHSSFRETRKSLARELISLQERLDTIKTKKPRQTTQEFNAEDIFLNTQNRKYVQEPQQEEKVAVLEEDDSGGINHGSHDTSQECRDKFCMKDGNNNISWNNGGNEFQSPANAASNEVTEPSLLPNDIVKEDVSQVDVVDGCNSSSDLCEADKMAVEPETKLEVDDIPIEADRSDMSALEELPVGAVDEEVSGVGSEKDKENDGGREEAMDRSLPTVVDYSARDGDGSEVYAVTELPVGLLDEDKAASGFEKDDETKISKGQLQAGDGECNAELLVGLLDEDTTKSEFEKHDETGEVLPPKGVKCNASEKDGAKETRREQQQREDQEEMQSSGESDGWVKIEFQKEDAPLDIEVQYQAEEEFHNGAELPTLITQANGHEPANRDECLEVNDVRNIRSESMEQEHVPIPHLPWEEEPEEMVAREETQVEGHGLVCKGTETLAKEEFAAASRASAEHEGGSSGDAKLLEENQKLRNMMNKLLEAGNEQLNVISNLTGRVKDLEKKLAKRKKARTKRHRLATAKIH